MSLVINNNLMAMNAARNLNAAYGGLANSIQRLSTGLRVNSAADDAAGLAVREGMRAEIAALNQGIRNANDGISMIQTAEGALSVIDEKLIRMKELAEQAATGTYTNEQRLIIHSEFAAMAAEIDRIAEATNFNGIYMLRGEETVSGTNGMWNDSYSWISDQGMWTNNSAWREVDGALGYTRLLDDDGNVVDARAIQQFRNLLEDLQTRMGAWTRSGGTEMSEMNAQDKADLAEFQKELNRITLQFFGGTDPSGKTIAPLLHSAFGTGGATATDLDAINDLVTTSDNSSDWGSELDLSTWTSEIDDFFDELDTYIGDFVPDTDSGSEILGGIKIHFGTGNNRAQDYYFVRIGDARSESLFRHANTANWDPAHTRANLLTQHDAQETLEVINTAIYRKENIRANLGAMQNRLENTITNLAIQAENLQASESRISDVDVANEMTAFVRNNVLTQAAVAMLAQANSMPQLALRLLS